MTRAGYLTSFGALACDALSIGAGDALAIKVEPENIEAAAAVADAAYRRGARTVELWPESARMDRSRIEFGDERARSDARELRRRRSDLLLTEGWALLSIKSPWDPATLDGVDSTRAVDVQRATAAADLDLRVSLGRNDHRWCVMAVPAPPWARLVMGIDSADEALERIWEAFAKIYRFDDDDPGAFWWNHAETLLERTRRFTDFGIVSLRAVAPGTDITFGLDARAVWRGGYSTTPDGRRFMPNVPTEEVYTAPHRDRTHGRVALSRPVRVHGSLVEGGWFEFDRGVVVACGADRNGGALEGFLAVDEGSRRLGEVALVDRTSPIFASGLLFQNILLDENAACHFALGRAYPTCVAGGESMDADALAACGINESAQHLDFMFGTPDMTITATCADGTERVIMRDGRFTA